MKCLISTASCCYFTIVNSGAPKDGFLKTMLEQDSSQRFWDAPTCRRWYFSPPFLNANSFCTRSLMLILDVTSRVIEKARRSEQKSQTSCLQSISFTLWKLLIINYLFSFLSFDLLFFSLMQLQWFSGWACSASVWGLLCCLLAVPY